MNKISFTVPGKPFGKQRPRVVHFRNGRSKAFTPTETVQYENLVKLCYMQEAEGEKFSDDAMLGVEILAYFEPPKSASKAKRKAMLENKIRPTKKPDFDNIGKIICDSLNQIAYHDDSAIVESHIKKLFGEQPRVEVSIKKIE